MKIKEDLKNKFNVKENYLLIITTTDKMEIAKRMVNALFNNKLIACAQIINSRSFYWWNKTIQNSKEYLILLKTKNRNYKIVEKVIKENHDYEIPEIIGVEIKKGSRDYFRWINSTLSKKKNK